MQKTERKAHTAISHNDSIPNRKRQKSTTGTASSILAKNSFLRSYSKSVEKNDVTYRGATLRPKYGLWLARFNTPSRQMMPPAVLSPVSMAMTVPPIIKEMMEKSFDILNHHPINEARAEKGLNKANSIWFWGAGTKPALDDFKEKTGMNGAMVSAVDLLKGIAVGANMRNLDVEGANGGLDTNYHGKAMAAVEALLEKNDDFAYIHVEAPDEMGHQGSLENKIKAIEHLDKEVVKVVKEELEKAGEDFRILIGPDHPTPIAIRTHSKEPIPFMIYDSTKDYEGQEEYSEEAARETGIVISHAYDLMNRLLQK